MVKVNDREMKWQKGITVEDAIRFAEYPEYNYPILVVNLNGVHIKNDKFKKTPIKDGDILKIMQPLAGG
ncbi:MAG: MoaD/ThiS family protein [Bacillota bacterium]|jgi:thiamine biosynthesis protein ThiS|nr:MoaD/ThiS family protein [Bacillota bacterium]MDD3297265.1 MoaD/ThiS family protein [Bacillota bacterium]MDD3850471.1 MoaD/ThiS family protein [Bacillota bacterium]MDD4708036.1 MoaD/ThiS family protein [Bacillota bacterium]